MAAAGAPLGDLLLAMDVADTLTDRPELADSDAALSAYYDGLGIALRPEIIATARAGLADRRFVYQPPTGGLELALAHLYVARRRWLPGAIAAVLALVIGLGGYFLVYQPYAEGQAARARKELSETIPATLDSLYARVFEETKVQAAATTAAAIRDEGKAAAAAGDRAAAERAIDDLNSLLVTVRADYRLTVTDRPGAKWGFWTFPEDNAAEANYYLVIDVRGPDGAPLAIPVKAGSAQRTETVSTFALRVPEAVYRSVEADQRDDGRIDRALVGIKQYGFLTPTYAVAVLGETLTRW